MFISKTQRENRPSDCHLLLNSTLATGAQHTQHSRQQRAHHSSLGPEWREGGIACAWEDGVKVIKSLAETIMKNKPPGSVAANSSTELKAEGMPPQPTLYPTAFVAKSA